VALWSLGRHHPRAAQGVSCYFNMLAPVKMISLRELAEMDFPQSSVAVYYSPSNPVCLDYGRFVPSAGVNCADALSMPWAECSIGWFELD
jgi:hypothetical protein